MSAPAVPVVDTPAQDTLRVTLPERALTSFAGILYSGLNIPITVLAGIGVGLVIREHLTADTRFVLTVVVLILLAVGGVIAKWAGRTL